MANLNKEVTVTGSTIYKPAIWVDLLKYLCAIIALVIFIYLVATRYREHVTLVQFAIMVILGFVALKIGQKEQAKLVVTQVDIKADNKEIEFKFNKTDKTKENIVKVKDIKDIIVLAHLMYIKLIDTNGTEVFEISLESLDDLRIASNYIIENTGAYLISM